MDSCRMDERAEWDAGLRNNKKPMITAGLEPSDIIG
jgi:hypothetical protein